MSYLTKTLLPHGMILLHANPQRIPPPEQDKEDLTMSEGFDPDTDLEPDEWDATEANAIAWYALKSEAEDYWSTHDWVSWESAEDLDYPTQCMYILLAPKDAT